MKRLLVILLALAMIFSFAACGGGAGAVNPYERDLDEEAFADYLAANITFTDMMSEIDDDTAETLYGLYGLTDADYDDLRAYMSTGATAEEIAVISVDNEQQAEAVKAVLTERIDAQIKSFENYVPGEVEKLSNAIVEQIDDVVILIVCDDYSEYKTARDTFLKDIAAVD